MNDNCMIKLWWPQERTVTGHKILGWHSDAVANGEIGEATDDVARAIHDLEDLGHIATDGTYM